MKINADTKKECQRIGINLLICRRRLNLCQKELAKRSGISRSVISNIERGNSNFKLRSLIMIAEAMGTDYRNILQ